jgi:hypothetical protein
MPTRISDALGVSHAKLDAQGVLDGFVDVDSHFHIHPALLANPMAPELAKAQSRLEKHFCDIILLLDAATAASSTDVFFRKAKNKLIFLEIPLAALGFARGSTRGRAIGEKLAGQVADTAFQIVKAGIKEPAIFELAGLFEEGIGADLISDMCIALILSDVLAFNDRIIQRLKLSTTQSQIGSITHDLPRTNEGEPVMLLPREILSPMPIASTWDDISTVADYNEKIRREINQKIGRTWGQASRCLHKDQIKALLLHNPDLLRDLIAQYKRNPPPKYDYINDPLGELIWFDTSQDYSRKFPLVLDDFDPSDHVSVVKTVTDICKHFKRLVEANGLFKLFYDQNQKLKPERAAQLLFYGIADAYCSANNLDLSAEPNAGRGPVDFKVSKGYHSRLNVEVKYTDNPKLVPGYEKQLPTYDKAEQCFESIYLVIDTGKSGSKLRKLQKLRADQLSAGKRAPLVMVIDGSYQRSASKLI